MLAGKPDASESFPKPVESTAAWYNAAAIYQLYFFQTLLSNTQTRCLRISLKPGEVTALRYSATAIYQLYLFQ